MLVTRKPSPYTTEFKTRYNTDTEIVEVELPTTLVKFKFAELELVLQAFEMFQEGIDFCYGESLDNSIVHDWVVDKDGIAVCTICDEVIHLWDELGSRS